MSSEHWMVELNQDETVELWEKVELIITTSLHDDELTPEAVRLETIDDLLRQGVRFK